ncbi:MFS transporter [Gorillibacterium sp. sgz5001074]|uniref:MFS transporter n=1 Tax=Gorillibacterium sp. sgz5001074 TaxID=3446695 RepID=UPI003F662577
MAERTKPRLPPMFTGMPAWLRGDGGVHAGRKHSEEGQSKGRSSGKLDGQAWLLLAVNGLFGAGNALSGTFVSVYLWKARNDFALIGWFAALQQITMALTFWIAGKWVKEHNKMNALRAGVMVSALFYGLVLFLGTSAVHFVWALGVVQGVAAGLFWLAFNVVYFEVTDPDSRDRFNGLAGLLGSGAGMLAPWISGILITRLSDAAGYRLIFSLSLGVFVLGAIASFFLKKRKVSGHYAWMFAFRKLRDPDRTWRKVFGAMVAQGIREGVFGFMIALMVYISTKNEAKLGSFSLITSAVAFASFYAVGRWLKPRFRKWGMLAGVTGMILVILPFFWYVDYRTLLIFGIGTALFIPFYTVPLTSSAFDLIGRDKESSGRREEFIILRELGLNAGRLLGTMAFILVVIYTPTPLSINVLLLAIGSSPLLVWLIMKELLSVRAASTGRSG